MSSPLYSPSWYRVAELKPRLRSHARLECQRHRGVLWHVVHDPVAGRSYRFGPEGYFLICRMDGKRKLQEIWELALDQLGDDCLTQDETIQLLGQLHGADLLQADVTPDNLELFRRQRRGHRRRWMQYIGNPLRLRIRLADPDRFLERLLPLWRIVFGPLGALAWIAVIAWGGVLTAMHWSELTANLVDRALAPHNLVLMWLLYPVVKTLHELGHGGATRAWGGQVHEMGLMFLILMPIPYVDASASSAFPERGRRMIVAGAGMMVELFVSALALMLWLAVEPGLVRDAAFAVMLIGGISTLLFNGNPLLRFDGYYIFADAVAIPNLATRSTRYLRYLTERYLFGLEGSESPVEVQGERAWLLVYGLASLIYRLVLMFVISMFIAGKWLLLGVLIGLWAVVSQIVIPLGRLASTLYRNPQLRTHRTRALAGTGVLLAVATALLALPLPQATTATGVLWLPEQARLRAGTDCFVEAVLVADGTRVGKGEPLVRCEDPFLEAEVATLKARLRELMARKTGERLTDLVRSEIVKEEITTVRAGLERAQERQAGLLMRSPVQGRFILPFGEDLPGSFVRQGDTLAYIVADDTPTVRVVVPQANIGLVRERTDGVEVRLAERPLDPIEARVTREVPAAVTRLPSPALGAFGGGPIEVDPTDPEGLRTRDRVFQLDVVFAEPRAVVGWGGRAQVRFDHGLAPLASQWYTQLRQLFLRELSV